MICRDALLLLEFARPGATELEATDIAALETHLADCRACSAFARSERQLNDRVVSAFDRVPEPIQGKSAILNQLANRSRAWQKQLALMSAIIVMAGICLWGAIPRPKLDPEGILADAQVQFASVDECEKWLASQNSHFQFPRGFQARYLINFERRAIHGTKAPVLTFVRGDSLARVTVLTPNQFRNLPKFENGSTFQNSVGTILILRDVPGVVYLVEIINGPVEHFYNEKVDTVT